MAEIVAASYHDMQTVVANRHPGSRYRGAFRRVFEQDRIRVVDVSVYTISARERGQLLQASAVAGDWQVVHLARRSIADAHGGRLVIGPERTVEEQDIGL